MAQRENYSSSGRAYHNLSHVLDCFEIGEQYFEKLSFQQELALWFHDVIYDPFSKTNEADSADEADKWLQELGIGAEDRSLIYQFIIATDHKSCAADFAAQQLQDIDLSILGSDSDRYREYARLIRLEYREIPEVDYKKGRRAVLKQFLDRDYIFATSELRSSREEKARSNLLREISELSSN